ncbi:DNA endonuclease RBBP8 [Melipona quadrifasciata]|uniref:DNA endonuclease RBBP8 n=1 Tax=Melipona quadrifasciata TaxID=166423 RepID=A0A0M8ZSK7_9HYME|nr:DNA endonuclease RBBP8 [Melipona quadrifasciata]
MALSDVLQFDCSIDNQIARNATKNFAGMLGKAFEQYKKLWNEYLKLLKHYEGVNFEVPLELFESNIFDNKDVIAPAIDQVSKNTEASTNRSISCSFDSISSVDNIVSPNTSINHQIQEDKLLKSPILIKKYLSSKKKSVTNGQFNLENCKKNEMSSCLPTKLNTSILINLENNVKQETLSENENKCSIIENKNDEIDTSVTKKLGISTLCNVNTTLLRNGKKLRQSKLVILEDEQSTNTIDQKYNSSNFSTVHVSPKSKKDIEEKFKNHNNSIEEDIIQSSPTKRMKLNSKIKNLKLKNITSEKRFKKQILSPNCHSSFLQKSIKENQPCLFTKPKVLNFCSGNVSNDDNGKLKENTYSEAIGQLLNTNSSTCDDETFYMLGEKFKQKSASDTNELENIFKNKSSRKNLMNSFDIPVKEKHIFVKPLKKKSERAQMNGVSCWECKQYYANLGLSEEEIKMRQNKCSRHRTVYEKNSTPDDFWNPLFPDASFNSTYQD